MTMGRDRATATLLLDGRVLIAGGDGYGEARSAETYDPKTGKFTKTGSMIRGHEVGTATLLLDGRVLIVGGWEWTSKTNRVESASADLYDPKTGTFTRTGSLSARWFSDTATRLLDGRVLITGSDGSTMGADPTNEGHALTAELYDPETGSFSPTGPMAMMRSGPSVTLLRDGRVLVAGGIGDKSAETYDPATGTFSPTGSMEIDDVFTATLLNDGRVLFVGDREVDGYSDPAADLYDPVTGKFAPTGQPKGHCLCGASAGEVDAPLLGDGRVLVPVESPDASSNEVDSAELYDPVTGTFSQAGPMNTNRSGLTDTLLADGRVLFAGDIDRFCIAACRSPSPSEAAAIVADRSSAELYVP
jgi:hypothetical protein